MNTFKAAAGGSTKMQDSTKTTTPALAGSYVYNKAEVDRLYEKLYKEYRDEMGLEPDRAQFLAEQFTFSIRQRLEK